MFNFKFPFFFKASGLLALPGVLFLSASLASAQPSVSNPLPVNEQAPLSPLMFVYSAELDDYFYSLKIDEIESAIHLHGYDDLQTASKIDILGYVESTAQTNTQLLRRMFKGFPHYSHYYTADEAEFESALANGYRFESNEGSIYENPTPGTSALYRLVKTNVSSGKKSFYYSARPDEIQKRLNSGYSLDGVVGHIYQTVTVNRAPFLERGRILGRRCPEATFDCGGELFRNYYFNQGINLRSLFKHGSRLDSHELLFTLTTWNGFSPENGHLVFMLRNQAEYDPTDVLKSRFDGVGIIIGAFNCPGNNNGNRVTVELWRPDTGTNGQNVVDCSFLSPELSPGVKYDFRVHSYNTGVLSYSIRDHKTQVLVFEKSKNIKDLYENMGGLYRPFPQPFLSAMNVPRNMNYSIFHGTDSKFDFTTYLENITSIWRTGNP